MDFTLNSYRNLLNAFIAQEYRVVTYAEFCRGISPGKFVILRHDIDRYPANALNIAHIENSLGINSSYYFRAKFFRRKNLIRGISALGHEIGYHYEDLVTNKGDKQKSYESFVDNLTCLRKLVSVCTIVMHGSPLSYIDNRELWDFYDYKTLGILGEPYFDVDFSSVFYLTDTGRSWNGVSRRDNVGQCHCLWQNKGFVYNSTSDIISALSSGCFPEHVMITTHPQRWTDNLFLWSYELVSQSFKNVIKRFVVRKNLIK